MVYVGKHHDKTHESPPLAGPGHAEKGHHDGKVCLSEWKAFFTWASEHGEGEKHLAKAEKGAAKADKSEAVIQERFNARVVRAFKALDTNKSGELSLPQMKLIFGEQAHEYLEDMDGETNQPHYFCNNNVWSWIWTEDLIVT